MLRMKTDDAQSYLLLKNPNDTLDFVKSISKELNEMLEINEEKTIGKVLLIYGPSKKTSEQDSKEYEGVKAFVTLIKKSISSMGTNGYFTGAKDRWKYSTIDEEHNRKIFRRFDNHIKINFKCKTAKERETMKTLITILLTFHSRNLLCDICDLDYLEDIETIKDDMFEFNVYIFARTVLRFEYDNNHETLKHIDYDMGAYTKVPKNVIEKENDDEVIFENGF